MSKTLWLDHCLRMAEVLTRALHRIPNNGVVADVRVRVRVELTCAEYAQLALEIHIARRRLCTAKTETQGEITLLGVAFIPKGEEYTVKLCTDLQHLHVENLGLRGRLYDEKFRDVGSVESGGRRTLDRGVHAQGSNKPGTDRRRTT